MASMLVVEETLKQIQTSDGVIGVIVANFDGIPIKSTLDNFTSVQYCGLVQQLIDKSKIAIKKNDPSDDLMFLRLRTKKHEILIVPEKQYVMIIVHNPTGSRPPL
ncbi:Dynein light chain roadblock-type 1/2,Roadblock/LAMTOR2 domain [Cinara cedri]|uniref:Dynein light chain roadblock n=1 Tax=Cinara cedri TaxID=506608 RepID=A0A5E4N3Z4_9HEMI|nr:Dynein light chain roadblock-type 1/2,Roadblock/LAMTOR2 domain [Cinara cedri]